MSRELFAYLEAAGQRNENIALHRGFGVLNVEIRADDDACFVTIDTDGVQVNSRPPAATVDFCLSAPTSHWHEHQKPAAGRDFQALSTMRRRGKLDVTGDMLKFNQNLMFLEQLFTPADRQANSQAESLAAVQFEDVVGRYVHLNIEGRPHRVYFEEAGQGPTLLCLHTAGADGRQFRHVLNDPAVTSRFRVIAFDLPWHGKSSPPKGFESEVYQLTTDRYVDTIMAFKEALGLERPVVMGCSIGGRVVLHLALRHPEQFSAVIGLQSALYAEDRTGNVEKGSENLLHRPDVHGGKISGALMNGVMAPQSPVQERWETMWHYMQGGPGIFMGDLHYYFNDGDLRNGLAEGLDVEQCPVYLLSGEYDPSATPEMGEALAKLIGATHFEVMREMGHFPMSENPELFRSYLLPVLDKIADRAGP